MNKSVENNSPLVSIVMPAYNAELHLEESVNSVLSQTYSNWELLIVNDASSDSTLELATRLQSQDQRINVYDQTQNQGVAEARNVAVKAATGKYIAFLDSDDLWVAEKLQKQIAYMEANEVLICYSAYQRIDENGKLLGKVAPPLEVDYSGLLKSNFIGNLTGVYNVEVLGKQLFSQFKHEDYVAWLALIKRAGQASGLSDELGMYRVYAGSISSNKVKTLSWQWRIYRYAESLGFLYSCWLMACYGYFALYKRV